MSITINSYTLPDSFKCESIEPSYDIDVYYDGNENWSYVNTKKQVIMTITGDIVEDTESDAWEVVKEIIDNCVLVDGFVDIVLDEGTYYGRCVSAIPRRNQYFSNIYHMSLRYVLKSEKYEEW